MTNVDKLAHGGVLDPHSLTDAQKQFINHHMTDEEVNTLINLCHKAGKSAANHPGGKPPIILAL
ncbi:MAG TPA: hypothetical protein VH877_17635 [Polyangia bacterium]|jgi:hypothetical protein|nr:hypothetical protein [Polyangia bacterium]